MAHLRVAVYTVTRGTWTEVAQIAHDGMLPIFEKQPGFVGYQLIDAGNSTGLSVSEWETEEEAEAATAEAADFVRDNLADRIAIKENYVGDDLLAELG